MYNYQINEKSLSPNDTARAILKLSIFSQITAETDRVPITDDSFAEEAGSGNNLTSSVLDLGNN